MINNYAIIENSVVTNIVIWDGGDGWAPPSSSSAILIPVDTFVNIGYTYNGTTFSPPGTLS